MKRGVKVQPDRAYAGRYRPLIALLDDGDADEVAFSFAEIEATTGWPLSVSAQVSHSLWTDPTNRSVSTWRALGWRARLDRRARRVVFRREGR